MNPYDNLAEEIKESIIEEYLRKNPDISRSEIVSQIQNGRVVVGTISELMQKISNRTSIQKSLSGPNESLLKKLAEGGDIRYANSLKSVDISKMYIQWLSGHRFSGLTDKEQSENINALDHLSSLSGKKALEAYDVKLKFLKAMKDTKKPLPSLLQTLMAEYFESTREQIKAQRLIFKREVNLGERFSVSTTGMIRDNFMVIRSVKNQEAMKAIEKAIQILKENSIPLPEIVKEGDIKLLTNSVSALEKKLDERRKELEELNQIAASLDEIIASIKAELQESSPNLESKYRTKRVS